MFQTDWRPSDRLIAHDTVLREIVLPLARGVLTGRRTVMQWLRWRVLTVAGGARERGLLNASLLLLQYI
jgi:hypothetical protein